MQTPEDATNAPNSHHAIATSATAHASHPAHHAHSKPEYDALMAAQAPLPQDHVNVKVQAQPVPLPSVSAPADQHHAPQEHHAAAAALHADPSAVTDAGVPPGQAEPHLPQQGQPVPDVDVEAVVGAATGDAISAVNINNNINTIVSPLQAPVAVGPIHPQDSATAVPVSEQQLMQHHPMDTAEPPSSHPLGAADPAQAAITQATDPQVSQLQVQQVQISDLPIPVHQGQAPPPSSPVQHPHHTHHNDSVPPTVSVSLPDSSGALAHGVNMSVGLPPVSGPVSTTAAMDSAGVPGIVGVPATIATSATATPVVSSMGVITTSNGLSTKMMTNNNNVNNINMSIPVLQPAPGAPSPHASATVPPLSHGQIYMQGAGQQHHHMDLNESGNLLPFGGTNDDVAMANANAGLGGAMGSVGQTNSYVNGGHQTVRVVPSTGDVGVGNHERKPHRQPGTKQCPTCAATIAAALATCGECGHVFRAKKDKPKRSGKRGKKNCPKCQYENPSACSSCKKCGYVFRLKLMDRYKQMRPRDNEGKNVVGTMGTNVGNVGNVLPNNLSNLHPPTVTSQVQIVQSNQNATAAVAHAGAAAVAAAANVGVNGGMSGGMTGGLVTAGMANISNMSNMSNITNMGVNVTNGMVSSSSVPPMPISASGSIPMQSGVQQYHAPLQNNAGYTHVAPLNAMPQSIQQVTTSTSTGAVSAMMNGNGNNNGNSNINSNATVTAMHHHAQMAQGHNPHAGI